jgi:hypothetical protein
MQGYNKGSVVSFMPVHYNGLAEASMQGYSKGSVGPFIPVHFNGLLESSMQAYSKVSWGISYQCIIMDK